MSEYLVLITSNKPRFTKPQLQTVVDICINVGSISLGSVFIPTLLGNFSLVALAIGSIAMIIFWLLAVTIAKSIHE